MREYLDSFMTECEYPTEAKEVVLLAFDKIIVAEREDFSSLLNDYDNSYNIDYVAAIERMEEISRSSGVHEYVGALLLFLCYTRSLRRYYREAGISEDIFSDTVLDLKYKLDECKCVYGIYGTFVPKWFADFFKLERFALGRLQFELVPLGIEYKIGDISFSADDRVVNVHIPRTGTRLDRNSVLDSYRKAADFYRSDLNGKIAFVCSSWLLFPRHREMLKDGSNLKQFISDYELIATGEYNDYKEVWRLFDTMYDGDVAHLPSNTSLRCAYIDIIRRGEPTGWGKGIFLENKYFDY